MIGQTLENCVILFGYSFTPNMMKKNTRYYKESYLNLKIAFSVAENLSNIKALKILKRYLISQQKNLEEIFLKQQICWNGKICTS